MVIDGIVLRKTPVKERDCLASLLTRKGEKLTFYFYGGMGGGKKSKSSLIELGHCLRVTPKPQRQGLDILIASEWSSVWGHERIRYSYSIFTVMTFWLEIIEKIAPLYSGEESAKSGSHEGLFALLSNALYLAENKLAEGPFEQESLELFFLTRLITELGIYPDVSGCGFCFKTLSPSDEIFFKPQDGQFICFECLGPAEQNFVVEKGKLKNEQELFWLLSNWKDLSFKTFSQVEGYHQWGEVKAKLINFLLIHQDIKPHQISSLRFLSLNHQLLKLD